MSADKIPNEVPRFKSLEEEADFWDSHSPLDYPDYWEETKAARAQAAPRGHILGVRLDAELIDELATLARSKGVGPSTLARVWLTERLAHEQQKERPKP